MKKQLVKIIKRTDGESKPPSPPKKKAKKKRSVESTIQGWITERRENETTEIRSDNSQLASWCDDTSAPADAI